jgi:hypothetical protein
MSHEFLITIAYILFLNQPMSHCMKETQPFPGSIFNLSPTHFATMNILRYTRQLAQGVLMMLCLLMAGQAAAQCSMTVPSIIPPFTITLDGSGNAVLDISNSPITTAFPCDLEFSIDGINWQTTNFTFDCTNLGAPITVFVRGYNPFIPASTPVAGSYIVNIDDVDPPVVDPLIGLPAILNTDAGQCLWIADNTLDATGTDNTSGTCPVTIMYNVIFPDASTQTYMNTLSGVEFPVGISDVEIIAIDAAGNSSVSVFSTVEVVDNEPPVATCPSNTTVNADAGVCDFTSDSGTNLLFDITQYFTDNCGNLTYEYRINLNGTQPPAQGPLTAAPSGTMDGVVFPVNVNVIQPFHVIRYFATDDNGNTSTCTFRLVVVDNEDPAFDPLTVPTNETLFTDDNVLTSLCFFDDFSFVAPDVADNCDNPLPTYEYRITGVTTLGWTATTQGAVLIHDFNVGSSTVQFRALDAAGNSTLASFTVVVVENEAPVVTPVPVSQTSAFAVNGTDCSKVVTFTRPSIGVTTDCSGPVSMTESVISGPDPAVLTGAPAFNPTTGGGTITVQFPAGTTEIEYCWEDGLGNSTCIIYEFIIDENVDPIANCQNRTVLLDASGNATLLASAANNGSSDNCPTGLEVAITAAGAGSTNTNGIDWNFDCTDLGTFNYTLTATDAAGNTNTDVCTVTVLDNVAPIVSCPVAVVQSANASCIGKITNKGDLVFDANGILIPGEYDNNCDNNNITVAVSTIPALPGLPAPVTAVQPSVTLSGVNFPVGTTTVVYNLTDAAGLTAACNFTVSVVDDVAPVATNCPPNITVNANIAPGCSYRRPNSAPGGCIIDANIPANQWCGSVTFTDNCSGTAAVTNIPSLTQTYGLGANPITISRTDAAGNVGTCSFTITVVDQSDPTAICQNLTRVLSAAPVNGGTVTVSAENDLDNGSFDNCYLDLIYEVKKGNASSANPYATSVTYGCGEIGINQPITLRITEDGGTRSKTATCTITIQDNTAPTISGCPVAPVVVNLLPTGINTLTAVAIGTSATDNCAGATLQGIRRGTSGTFAANIAVSCTDVPTNFPAQVMYQDAQGNQTICSFQVDVNDVTPPTLSLSNNNQTVECASPFVMPAPVAVANDVCNGNVASTLTQLGTTTTVPGSCPGNYQLISTWRVTDLSGNTNTAVYIVNVRDTQVPALTAPANATINLAPNATCFPTGSYTASVTDNCSAGAQITTNWVITYADGRPVTSGTGLTATTTVGFATGINTITFTSTDACGNTTTKTQTVTVVDGNAPVFNSYLQPNTLTYCGTVANPVIIPLNNVTNNCGATFNWFRPYGGPVTNLGFATVSPNVSDCNPVTLAESITLPNGNTLVPNLPFNGNNPINSLVPMSQFLPVGATTFTYTASAATGLGAGTNSTACVFRVVVTDTQAPVLSGIQTAILNSICPTQTVPDYRGLVTITDNCPSNVVLTQQILSPTALPWTPGGVTLAQVFAPGGPVDNATFIVRVTANDGFNPAVTRDITVTLDDNQAPVFTDANLSPALSDCGYIILEAPTATTNDCGPNSGTLIYGTPGGVPAIGQDVLVGSNPIVYTTYRIVLPQGFTTCQPYVITWAYNDGNGNVSTQFQSLQLCPDVTPPTAQCSTNVQVVLNPTTATLTVAQVDNGSFDDDDCNPFTLAISKGPGGPFASSLQFTCADVSPNNTGATTVVLRATDNVNSTMSSTCTVQVKVLDNTLPTITATTVPANLTLNICSLTDLAQVPAPVTVTATDNCDATVSFSETSTIGTTGAAKYNYDITRTWTATDVFGNTATRTQVIAIRDNAAPVFATPANLTFATGPSAVNCTANVTFSLSNFVSDCAPDGELNLSVTPNYFSLTDNTQNLPVGSHTVTFTASDPAGNSSSATLTFVVTDGTNPVANCINGISVTLNQSGQAIVTPNLVNNQSNDNCTAFMNLTLLVQELDGPNGDTIGNPTGQLLFGCGEADGDTEYPMILVVKDQAGNTSVCETYVVIQDNVAPMITCPASISVDCSANLNPMLAVNGTATAVDNCGPTFVTVTYTDAPQYNGYTCGNVVRTWKAEDQAGNMSSCVQTFTITDTKPPIFLNAPQSGTFSCLDPLSVAPVLTAADVDDDCTPSDSIKIVFTQVSNQGTTGCAKYNFTTTRTWTITDKCNNTNTHTQTVTVADTQGPKFLGLNDTIFIQSASFPATTNCTVPVQLNPGLPSIFSDCAPLAECTINSISFFPTLVTPIVPNGLDVSGNYPVGTTRVIFQVTDPCGNQTIDTVYVKVTDNSTPTAICRNNIVVSLGNNGQGTITANDVNLNSTDNCGIATLTLSQSSFDCQDLGINQVSMTATDLFGNSNSCTIAVEVVAGNGTGFSSTVSGTPTSYFGASDGEVTAAATGGSSNFSYEWDDDDASTTATVTDLPAGTYFVTITDTFTGCEQVDTAIVAEGPKVKFTVGNVTGTSGSIVKVPVYATHFNELSGFSFTLNLANTAIGNIVTPVAVSNVNPMLTGLSASPAGPALAVFWTENAGNNITLNNGAQVLLFELCVQLSQAPLGTSSDVIVDGLPPDPDPLALRDGGVIALPTDFMNGSIQITLGLNEYDIAGDIQIWNPSVASPGVANVTVNLTGITPAPTFTTLTNGQYNFNNIPATTNTVTTPSKITQGPAFNSGISVADHILLKQHLGSIAPLTTPFTSPYQFVAADVNFSGTINIIDLNLIQRVTADNKRLSQITPTAPKDWVFVPKTYTFPVFGTSIPFANVPAYPQTIVHTPIFQDQLNDDFVAVRLGDLNGNSPLTLAGDDASDRSAETLVFKTNDRDITAGETLEVAFTSENFTERLGYQFTLGFDPNVLEVIDVVAGDLPGLNADNNFGTLFLNEGSLTTVWSDASPVTRASDAVLFTVKFKALHSSTSLSQSLTMNSNVTEALAIGGQMNQTDVQLVFGQTSSANDPAADKAVLYQNQPNPFADNTQIAFRLAANERAMIRVFGADGSLVRTIVGDFAKGYNSVDLRSDDLGAAGVYYYELSTPTFTDRKKMILID